MEQEYIITVFSENKVGLLSQITTVFTCRSVNIESLTTSESAIHGIHKFTIVVRTTPERVEQLVRQIEKRIDVLRTFVYTPDEVVQQEIALYKVTRSRNVERLVRDHNVRILEVDPDYIVVEKTGHKAETQALFELLQPYGVQQFVRSGTVAVIKSQHELLNEYLEEFEKRCRRTNNNEDADKADHADNVGGRDERGDADAEAAAARGVSGNAEAGAAAADAADGQPLRASSVHPPKPAASRSSKIG